MRCIFTSPSLVGVWAAVAAGLGATVRTALALPPRLQVLAGADLPALPMLGLRLCRSEIAVARAAVARHRAAGAGAASVTIG